MTTPHSSWARYYNAANAKSFGAFYEDLTKETLNCVTRIQPPPARIVDFGAGTGRLALPLAALGYAVVAIDPCAEMLAVLRSNAEKQNLLIQTACCRMQDDIGSARFDIALCVFTVLSYFLDQATLGASFERAAAALRPGGYLLLDIPAKNLFSSFRRTGSEYDRDVQIIPETDVLFRYDETARILDDGHWVNYSDSFKIRYWDQAHVLSVLENAGFVIEQDLSAQFAGSGSNYFLATRCGGPDGA